MLLKIIKTEISNKRLNRNNLYETINPRINKKKDIKEICNILKINDKELCAFLDCVVKILSIKLLFP